MNLSWNRSLSRLDRALVAAIEWYDYCTDTQLDHAISSACSLRVRELACARARLRELRQHRSAPVHGSWWLRIFGLRAGSWWIERRLARALKRVSEQASRNQLPDIGAVARFVGHYRAPRYAMPGTAG